MKYHKPISIENRRLENLLTRKSKRKNIYFIDFVMHILYFMKENKKIAKSDTRIYTNFAHI